MSTETSKTGASGSEPQIILHRDLSTQNQVNSLLAIGGAMMDFLTEKPKDAENIPGLRPLPGEARAAAETTLIKVCDRLDTILDEKERWGIAYQLSLEKMFIESAKRSRILAERQLKMFLMETQKAEAQRDAALEVKSPHFRYKPTLFALKDGGWAAFLGDENDLDHGITGVGASPAEALKAFDMVFSGKMPEHMKQIAQQREKELDENDTVDLGRDQTTRNDDRGGEVPPADSENPGSQL